MSRMGFDEKRSVAVADFPCLIDAATVQRLAVADGEGLTSRRAKVLRHGTPEIIHGACLLFNIF